MKSNYSTTIIFMLSLGLGLISCSKDDNVDPLPPQEVSFGFVAPNENSGRIASELIPDKVRVTIKDMDEEILIQEGLILELFSFGDSYVSESLTLVTQNYQLTLFQVLDENDHIIYAAPLEGSDKASLVSDPLPLLFEVEEEGTTTVTPEVLLVAEEDDPTDFGYIKFDFEIVNSFSLDLLVLSDWDSSFLEADWIFTSFTQDSSVI
ncbi:MAG: hypothetical protein AAFY41_12515, partial [Bacteroidota bacterium]